MSTKQAGPKPVKREYRRPRVRTIELAASEVLGFGCKMASGGSNSGSPPPCTVGGCGGVSNS